MEYLPLLMLVTLMACFFVGYPIAFTLGGVAVIFGSLSVGYDIFSLLPLRIWGRVNNIILISVPMFILMGIILERTGISEELLNTLGIVFKRVKGGVPLSLVIVGAILAASTGIVGATVVTMGTIALPGMLKQGYRPQISTGTICAVGTLGQIIPPSIILVLLGDIVGVSVGALFAAAILPGALLVCLYALYIFVDACIHPPVIGKDQTRPVESVSPENGHPEEEPEQKVEQNIWILCLKTLVPPAVLVISVLGSIFMGIASPTEAAAVGAFGSLIIGFVKKRIDFKTLKTIAITATRLNSMVFLILIGATAFGLVFRMIGGDDFIHEIFLGLNISRYGVLAIIMLIIFILGFFLDVVEIIFIMVPILVPIVVKLGFDPLWICVLITINLQTAFLTPPMGFAIFYLKAVSPPEVKTTHIYRGVIPFVVLQVLTLIIVMTFPQIVTWLPTIMVR